MFFSLFGSVPRCKYSLVWRTCQKYIFRAYCDRFDVAPEHFAGFELFDFIRLEDFFELNLVAFSLRGFFWSQSRCVELKLKLDRKVPKLVQRSRELLKDTMRLNVYENLSTIVNFDQYCGVYECIHCDKLCYNVKHYYRHTKSFTATVHETFQGGIHKNPITILEKLEEIGICVPHCDRHFPFFACFDFEVYFSEGQICNSFLLILEVGHLPLSVAIASSI